MQNQNKVSVIIPCRNEIGHIRLMLDSLLRQDTAGLECEFLIADGMSDDGTREALLEHGQKHSRIRLIDNPGQVVSTGLNAAIRAAEGDIIIRMDGHTEYAPDYIKQCLETLERTGADNVGGPARTKAEGLIPRAIAAAFHSPFSTGGARFHNCHYEGYADTVPYGCWRKQTLFRIGLFDETLVRNQDDELNLRLTRAGGSIWQSSKIVSWYRPRTTLRNLARQYFQYGFWKVPVIRKHRIPASWRHLVPGCFALWNAVLPLLAAGAAVTGNRAWFFGSISIWVASAALYAAACLTAARLTAGKQGWPTVICTALAFVIYHFSYGLGFLSGLLYWSFASTGQVRFGQGLFSHISR